MLIKIRSIGGDVWINPKAVNYVYKNSDGNAVIGCGDERFEVYEIEPDKLIAFLNTTNDDARTS